MTNNNDKILESIHADGLIGVLQCMIDYADGVADTARLENEATLATMYNRLATALETARDIVTGNPPSIN
jgi:hypothetical protein